MTHRSRGTEAGVSLVTLALVAALLIVALYSFNEARSRSNGPITIRPKSSAARLGEGINDRLGDAGKSLGGN